MTKSKFDAIHQDVMPKLSSAALSILGDLFFIETLCYKIDQYQTARHSAIQASKNMGVVLSLIAAGWVIQKGQPMIPPHENTEFQVDQRHKVFMEGIGEIENLYWNVKSDIDFIKLSIPSGCNLDLHYYVENLNRSLTTMDACLVELNNALQLED